MTRLWNVLPGDIRECTSEKGFEAALHQLYEMRLEEYDADDRIPGFLSPVLFV